MSLITLVLKRIRGKKIFCFQSQKDRNPFNYDHANPHLSKAANYMSGGHPVIQKTCHYFRCHTLRHLSTHPNYPACNLKGFSRSTLDVLISRTHPLPFNRRGKRGNEWCRACQAIWERHGTYRSTAGPSRASPYCQGLGSFVLKLLARALQSLLGRTGKSPAWQQPTQLVGFLLHPD